MDFAIIVATVLTVYGIETLILAKYLGRRICRVATVLTVYGIETGLRPEIIYEDILIVATVLTVYGIETYRSYAQHIVNLRLQQYLPFTVLKRDISRILKNDVSSGQLQQYLPFTVLKL